MIDFRYHVVSIVAVFLALALGLFLGSTTLQGRVFDDLKGRVHSETRTNDQLRSQVAQLQGQISDEQQFDKALLPSAVAGKLSGQIVSVVSMPGASDATRKQLFADVDAAGGTVGADVRIQQMLVDPKQESFLTALTDRVHVPGRPDTATAGDARARAAAQLAAVLGVRPSSHNVAPATVDTVLAAYSAAKLISASSPASTPRPGTLAIVLAGPAPATTADPAVTKATQDLAVDLVRDLDTEALGAVLAGPTPAPGDGTDLVTAAAGVANLTQQASTVVGVDLPAGQIAAIYAMAAQADGVAGRYGPGAPAPLPSASTGP